MPLNPWKLRPCSPRNIFHILITRVLRSKRIIIVLKEFQICFHIIFYPVKPITWTKKKKHKALSTLLANSASWLVSRASDWVPQTQSLDLGSHFMGTGTILSFALPGLPASKNFFFKCHHSGQKKMSLELQRPTFETRLLLQWESAGIQQTENTPLWFGEGNNGWVETAWAVCY